MKIKEGEKLPVADFFYLDDNNALQMVDTNTLLKGHKVIIFGVPGAFTKVCSAKHLPGYVKNFEEAKKKGVFVLVDPKGQDFSKYKGASIITPNYSEFVTAVGKVSSDSDLTKKAKKLLSDLKLQALLITRGSEGMTLIQKNKSGIKSLIAGTVMLGDLEKNGWVVLKSGYNISHFVI